MRNMTRHLLALFMCICLVPLPSGAEAKLFSMDVDAMNKAAQSVLMLEVYDKSNKMIATASGIVAFNNYTLVTNNHVIEDADNIIGLSDNGFQYMITKVIAADEDRDIAILEFFSPTDLAPLALADGTEVRRAESVVAIGSPKGVKNSITKGNISAIYHEKGVSVLQFSAPISSGSSGGALFNDNGDVIGITFATYVDGQNMNLAIDIKEVIALYESSRNNNRFLLGEYRYAPKPTRTPSPAEKAGQYDELYVSSKGTAVTLLQYRLKELGYFEDTVSGYYSDSTVRAVQQFQRVNGLWVNGIASEQMQGLLFSSKALRADSLAAAAVPSATPKPTATLAVTAAPTAAVHDDNWTYTLSGKNAIITGYKDKTISILNIPGTIDGHAVTGIGVSAFDSYNHLLKVVVSDGVKNIGYSAFSFCSKLKEVVISSSVTSIGIMSFFACDAMEYFDVANENRVYESMDGVLFQKNPWTLLQYPAKRKGTVYEIPTGVENIGDFAFVDSRGLTSVNIPISVKRIGEWAFAWCDSLYEVTLPRSVKYINMDAFHECSSLTLRVPTDSYAKKYAVDHDIPYKEYSEAAYHVGEQVLFGAYEQDNNTKNGKEPIAWRVLAVQDSKALLLSEKSLYCLPFNTQYANATWQACSLRVWLNNSFLDSAFSAREQQAILVSEIQSDDAASLQKSGGYRTMDRIFLLSRSEVERYMPDKNLRKAVNTAYAKAQGAYQYDGYGRWWLRSPGLSLSRAAYVDDFGTIKGDGDHVNKKNFAVRPAIWADIDAISSMAASAKAAEEAAKPYMYEIAMVTDVGNIDDKSFNQSTWEGVKGYAEANGKTFAYYRPSEDSTESRVESIKAAIEKGAKVVVCPGYLFEDAIYTVQGEYPEVQFLLLDGEPHTPDYTTYFTAPNTHNILYREEQAGYFAGYAAVKDGYTQLGFLGGMDVPAVIRFGFGYVQGADAAAKEMGIIVSMKYWYSGTFGPNDEVKTKMNGWYTEGTQVVFACGGGIYLSCTAAAVEAGAKVIGVDKDQAFESPTIITSAMKDLTNSVKLALTGLYANGGKWPAEYAGATQVLGAAENCVGLPTAADSWRLSTFTVAEYEALFAKVASGEIIVSNATDVQPAVTNVTVDYQN